MKTIRMLARAYIKSRIRFLTEPVVRFFPSREAAEADGLVRSIGDGPMATYQIPDISFEMGMWYPVGDAPSRHSIFVMERDFEGLEHRRREVEVPDQLDKGWYCKPVYRPHPDAVLRGTEHELASLKQLINDLDDFTEEEIEDIVRHKLAVFDLEPLVEEHLS